MHEVLTDSTFEGPHRHPLITRTILFLVQWLTLQRCPRGFHNDFDKFSHGLKNYYSVYLEISIRKRAHKVSYLISTLPAV